MKRGKILSILILVFILVLVTVSAENGDKNPDYYIENPDEFIALSANGKKDIIEKATPEQGLKIIENYLQGKYGIKIQISGLEGLKWGEGGIVGAPLVYIDLENLPKGVKSIKFEGDLKNGKFIIEFEDNSKIEFDKGFLSKERNLIVTNEDGTYSTYKWNGKGEFIYENREFILRDGSELLFNGNTYKIYTQGNLGEIKIKFDENGNPEILGYSRVDSNSASVIRMEGTDRPYKLFFDEGDHSDYEGDYVQINGEKLLNIGGEDLEIILNKGFNKVDVDVNADRIKLWNGKRVIEYKEGKVNIFRSGSTTKAHDIESTRHDIKKLKIGDLKDNEFFKIENGRLSFFDGEEYRYIRGYTNIGLGKRGLVQIGEFKSYVSKEDLEAIRLKIKREDFNSDEEYNLAIENEIQLGRADWELSIDPGSRLFKRFISKKANQELRNSDIANMVASGYDSMDSEIAGIVNEVMQEMLETRPLVSETIGMVQEIPGVDSFLNNLGIANDLTVSQEAAEKSRVYLTENIETMLPELPDRIPVGDKIKEKFGLRSSEIPKSVFAAVLVLSNNREAYEGLGRFIESSTVVPGNGINMGVYGREVGIVSDATGKQYITSPKVLNAMRTMLDYVAPEYLNGNNRHTLRSFEYDIQRKAQSFQGILN